MLECVVNVSEGRDAAVLGALADACGPDLLDLHVDAHHNRAVFTLVGEAAPRRLADEAWRRIDLSRHEGVHPRLGVVDVVPFVPLAGADPADALRARDSFARWAADEHGVACFLYGPERSLPEIRRRAADGLAPDRGPTAPDPERGAVCVGARDMLVAWNMWLDGTDLAEARRLAAELRGPHLRTLALDVGGRTQLSCNLISPEVLGPAAVHAMAKSKAAVTGCELVGLVGATVLAGVAPDAWSTLDLDVSRTVEARIARRALRLTAAAGRVSR